jgi:hypothetical protein
VLRCDVIADECDRFVDDSESISRGLVRRDCRRLVGTVVCTSAVSLSLSLKLSFSLTLTHSHAFHHSCALTPLRLSHGYFSISTSLRVECLYQTNRTIIMYTYHTHAHRSHRHKNNILYDFMESRRLPCAFL